MAGSPSVLRMIPDFPSSSRSRMIFLVAHSSATPLHRTLCARRLPVASHLPTMSLISLSVSSLIVA